MLWRLVVTFLLFTVIILLLVKSTYLGQDRGLGYASAVVPAVLPRCSSASHRTSSGEDAGEGRSIHRPTPKGAASNQGDGRNRYKGDMGVKSGNTSVSPPKHPPSFPNANERKKGDKSELKRL